VQPTFPDPPLQLSVGFERWYCEHFDYVWNTLRRLGAATRDVPDLAHDVFLVAWQQRDSIDLSRSIRPWLFGVAFRVHSAHRRRAWFRLRTYLEPPEPRDPALDPERRAVVDRELQMVNTALGHVPLLQRAVLLLHDFDQVDMHEVASTFGISPKTAYSRLSAARTRFRRAYRQLENVGTRHSATPEGTST
jgi:RNA polymerase sigma-70 factor (ECF subfamily)